ncbi:MAG TPA: hypothetical protein EYH42_09375 [Sulfurovum sp.]|nr:hypothetical protein [Sulfurovum sp.]
MATFMLAGCGSKKKVYPIHNTSVEESQNQYEHLPKPIVYQNVSIEKQRANFKSYVGKTFRHVDAYKKDIENRIKTKSKRYGKNRISSVTSSKKTQKKDTENRGLLYDLYIK